MAATGLWRANIAKPGLAPKPTPTAKTVLAKADDDWDTDADFVVRAYAVDVLHVCVLRMM